MINYRLLRDNKETGPYSEEEMIAKGFKPYDLLWAEGKSAGWQYPSEIPAFKKYAPIVEEQPYDRFYKKQPQQKSAVTEDRYSNNSYTPAAQPAKRNEVVPPVQQQPAVARPVYEYNVQDLPARHIHVTLPSGNTVNLTTLVSKKEVSQAKETTDQNNRAVKNESLAIDTEKINTEKKQPSFAESFSAPQQATIKETKKVVDPIAVKTTEDNYAIASPVYQLAKADFSWTLIFASVIGIATLVGLGIMIGLSINREKNNTAFNEALASKTKQNATHVVKPVAPAITTTPENVIEEPVTQPQHITTTSPAKNRELVQNAVVKTSIVPENNNYKDEKKSAEINNSVTDKTKAVQTQDEAQHSKTVLPVALSTIEKSLHVSSNDFKTGAFGGIKDLKCILYNGSKLPLESVEVEVDYIQSNDKVYKTEKILFKDVAPGSQTSIDAPPSQRGVKIISRVIKVKPSEATLINTTARS